LGLAVLEDHGGELGGPEQRERRARALARARAEEAHVPRVERVPGAQDLAEGQLDERAGIPRLGVVERVAERARREPLAGRRDDGRAPAARQRLYENARRELQRAVAREHGLAAQRALYLFARRQVTLTVF